ncbi:MAG TPA: DUF3408 domain-containing protein [Agriterribacter sp.]|uniref:DUF3408 domain-containing protein n=1 Tax=Agriterribacter sp. TaxID=2821509 RepID=UPI002C57D590|nr:DUF3408 domain-containing protein [Agriterribacter sp.]HRO46309.1 DUF3408 domain-containing protein [Agriterribacter sp.]HRQ19241.1 DUF3408 domain-containing protein [Agriterribacter sp.]
MGQTLQHTLLAGLNQFYNPKKNKFMKKNAKPTVATGGNQSTKNENYETLFLQNNTQVGRGDRSIYIRQDYHHRLIRIVQVIGEGKIPMYAYLDNILTHHFNLFEKAIIEDYNRKQKPIF